MTAAAHAAPRRINWSKLTAPVRALPKLVKPATATIRSATLQISGLAGFTYAAWMLAEPAGVAVGGLSLFVLNWLLTDPPSERR